MDLSFVCSTVMDRLASMTPTLKPELNSKEVPVETDSMILIMHLSELPVMRSCKSLGLIGLEKERIGEGDGRN